MVRPLKVLFLSAEASPLAKVGGLGDVGGELPRALRRLGIDVRTSLPRYPSIELGSRRRRRGPTSKSSSEGGRGRLPPRAGSDVLLVDGEPVAGQRSRRQGRGEVHLLSGVLAACRQCMGAGCSPRQRLALGGCRCPVGGAGRKILWRATATVFTIHNWPTPARGMRRRGTPMVSRMPPAEGSRTGLVPYRSSAR
jgi:hypothetical protein